MFCGRGWTKEVDVLFVITIIVLLLLASAYLLHQWYTSDLGDPGLG